MTTITATYDQIEAAILPMARDTQDYGYYFGGESYAVQVAQAVAEWAIDRHWDEDAEAVVFHGTYADLKDAYEDARIDAYCA